MSDNTKQLYRKSSDGSYPKIFPLAFVQGIKDKRNNKELLSYINEINHFKVDYNENPETTRCQVDNFIRKKGLYITYYNTDTEESVTEYFKGNQSDVTDDSIWGNSDNWELVPDKTYIESHAVIPNKSVTLDKLGDDVIAEFGPADITTDEEDLTTINKKIKFKNKEYNSEEASGLGYKILRKNWVEDKNILTQDMISDENTIYEIRYDFDLNGEEIIIPENCVLKFEGGSLNNGIIVGNNTIIKSKRIKIFNSEIILNGIWNVNTSYPEWFGASNNTLVDSALAIQKCIEYFKKVHLKGSYKSNNTIYIYNSTVLYGDEVYAASILFDDNVNIGITQINDTTLRGVTLKNFSISKNTKNAGTSGILLSSATQTSIENVTVIRFSFGFDLNSFYVSTIKRCDATSCDIGFYFGRNEGNSTSVTINSCYALWCDIGYELKKIVYSTLNACACDQSRIAYDFWHCSIILNGCGCESITERILCLDAHSGEDELLNKNNNQIIINGFNAISINSTEPIIKITPGTRLAYDRNMFYINGIKIGFLQGITPANFIIQYNGDTQLYISKITKSDSIELFDIGNLYNTLACAGIYVEGIRRVNRDRANSQYVIKRFIGDCIEMVVGGIFMKSIWNGTSWVDSNGFTPGVHKGKTVHRPSGKNATPSSSLTYLETTDIGFEYYDTDLHIPVYVKEIDINTGIVTWVDATGQTV